jgi:hypothetical protein
VLADTLRTDRARLRPLQPDSPATTALRATVRARRDLVAHPVAVCNQLRAHLQKAFPARSGCSPSWTADQPGLPDPLRLPGPRRLALSPFLRATPSSFNDAAATMCDDDTGFRCATTTETLGR